MQLTLIQGIRYRPQAINIDTRELGTGHRQLTLIQGIRYRPQAINIDTGN